MRKKTILSIAAAAAVGLVLLYVLFPRSFPQIIGGDFAPDQVDRISVLLHTTGGEDTHSFTLSPADSQALLDRLSSRSYFPMPGTKDYQYITLDYQVTLNFDYNDYSQYVCLDFCGDNDLHIHRSTATRSIRIYGDSEAFQQEVLDLLLTMEPKID